MKWTVQLHDAFDAEFDALPEAVQDELLAHAKLLEQFGPALGRPRVDTLNGSRYANMKELRFDAADGVSPSPSIPDEKPSSCAAATNRGEARSAFTGDL